MASLGRDGTEPPAASEVSPARRRRLALCWSPSSLRETRAASCVEAYWCGTRRPKCGAPQGGANERGGGGIRTRVSGYAGLPSATGGRTTGHEGLPASRVLMSDTRRTLILRVGSTSGVFQYPGGRGRISLHVLARGRYLAPCGHRSSGGKSGRVTPLGLCRCRRCPPPLPGLGGRR
jgi:hypothetical protein